MTNSLEEDFDTIRDRIHDKMVQATKLIEEASVDAYKLGLPLDIIDYDAVCDLKAQITDSGLEPKPVEAWTSSQVCW